MTITCDSSDLWYTKAAYHEAIAVNNSNQVTTNDGSKCVSAKRVHCEWWALINITSLMKINVRLIVTTSCWWGLHISNKNLPFLLLSQTDVRMSFWPWPTRVCAWLPGVSTTAVEARRKRQVCSILQLLSSGQGQINCILGLGRLENERFTLTFLYAVVQCCIVE